MAAISLNIAWAESWSLTDFLQRSINHGIEFQALQTAERTISFNRILSGVAAPWGFTVAAGQTLDLDDGDMDPRLSLGATKLLKETGTKVEGGFTKSRSTSTGLVSQKWSLDLSQPFFRNQMGRQYKILDLLADMAQEQAQLNHIEAFEQLIIKRVNLYYDWFLAYEEKRRAEILSREYDDLLKHFKQREQQHIAREVDVAKIRVQVLDKRESMLTKQEVYLNLMRELSGVLEINVTDSITPVLPDLLNEPVTRDLVVFYQKGRSVLLELLAEQIASLNVILKEDGLKPPIEAELSWQSTSYPSGGGTPASSLFGGINVGIPFSSEQERAAMVLAQLGIAQTKLSIAYDQDQRAQAFDQILRKLKLKKEIMTMLKRKIEYLRIIQTDEEADYKAGRASLNELIQARNNLETARQNLLQETVAVEKLKLDWLELTDQLVGVF